MNIEIPEYSSRLTLAIERNADLFPKGGSVIEHLVKHNDCCRLLIHALPYDCSPDVEISAKGQRYCVLPGRGAPADQVMTTR
jgi:hypothetical protein